VGRIGISGVYRYHKTRKRQGGRGDERGTLREGFISSPSTSWSVSLHPSEVGSGSYTYVHINGNVNINSRDNIKWVRKTVHPPKTAPREGGGERV